MRPFHFLKKPLFKGQRWIYKQGEEPPPTIAQRVDALPKRAKTEDLNELKKQIEGLDDVVETVAQLDVQQERSILRKEVLLQQVLSRFRRYELQLNRLETQDLTDEEQDTVREIKRLMDSLRDDMVVYEEQEAQLFQDERSVLRRTLRSKANDYEKGTLNYADYRQFLEDIPDGSLDRSDTEAILYALHMAAWDRSGDSDANYERIAGLLLVKITPGAFRRVDDIASMLRSRALSPGIKIAFLDKISTEVVGAQAFGRFLIDWDEDNVDDLQTRLGDLPDGSITERKMVDQLVPHVLKKPALKEVIAAKLSEDLKEYFSTEVYGARLDEVTTYSDGRGSRFLSEHSEQAIPKIVAILNEIPEGSLRDEDQYQMFLFRTFYYPEQQAEMARKFATREITTLWNFRHIMKWTSENPSLQSTFSYRGEEQFNNPNDVLDFLAWTMENPQFQGPFLRTEEVERWAKNGNYYVYELVKKTSHYPDFQQALLRALPAPKTVTDFAEMARCFPSGTLGAEWLEPIADDSLEVEKPESIMRFVTLFPVEAYPLAAAKIAQVSWDAFMSNQENYLDEYTVGVEEYKLSQAEYPFVTQYPTLFVDTQPYRRDESVTATFEFSPRIATADDLQKAMDRIPDMNKKAKANVWALWEKYEATEAARQAVIAERITPELVQSEGFFENFSEKSKWGERYRSPDFKDFPYLAYKVCLHLPDERFSERVFVEDLAEVNYPPLNALLVEKMNIDFSDRDVLYGGSVEFLKETTDSPELQAAYLKNLVPNSLGHYPWGDHVILESTKNSPTAQILLVRAFKSLEFSDLKDSMNGSYAKQAPKDQPLCFEARVVAARRLAEDIEYEFKRSIARGYSEPDTDMVRYFQSYPEIQSILVEALFPYMPNIAIYNRGADSGREHWWETGNSLPDLDFVNDKNRTRLAEHVVRVVQATDMDITDVAQALQQVKADLNEKNFEDYCDLMIVSGKNTTFFLAYAFAPVADKFERRGYKGIRKYWEELTAFSKECKDIGRVLPLISDQLTEKNLPEYHRLMVEAGESAYELLEYAFEPVQDQFNQGGYKAIEGYWRDLSSMANLSEQRDDFLRNVFPSMAADFATNEQDRGRLVEIAEWAGPKHDVFFKVVYPRMRAQGWTLQNEAPWRDLAETFKREGERLDWRLDDRFCEEVFTLGETFAKPFGELLTYFGEFYEGSGDRLPRLVNAQYATATPDLAPLKNVATTLYGFGDDALLRFGQGMDWNVVLAHYRQKGDVEAKVLVVRGLSGYFESEKARIVEALGLTKKEVDAFLEGEFARSDQRTAYLYYGFEGYGLVGTDEEKKELLKRFDFEKLMAQDQVGLEVFGLLEAMEAPFETWDRAIAAFKLDVHNLSSVEQTRQKLLGVTREKANQVIEAKAQVYIEESITPQNIEAKVSFVKNWSNPKIEVGYGLDERFVLDVYRVPGERMRTKLKEHYASSLMKGFETLGIFSEMEVEEIQKTQAALREVARARAAAMRPVAPPVAPSENPERTARVATMREWILNHSSVAEVQGMIQTSVQLEERLVLYTAYQQQGLENRLPLVREQLVSYVNRHPEALTTAVSWKGRSVPLEAVLPECGIALVSSADNAGSRGAKLMDPNVPMDYKAHKVKEKIDYNSRQAKESLFGLKPATIQGGLHFESGFEGGGEHYEGGRVVLKNDAVQPSTTLYTVERDGVPEAVVIQFDPGKGARFDFEVQVGATTTGSKANLTHELKRQHGEGLIMDTVGSMVQGEGIPISMIFKDGEPQNKKTTMEGQRDGMVVFSPSGRMGVMDKTSIRYSDLSDIVNLKQFGAHLEGEIKSLEDQLYASLGEGVELTEATLETLTRDNPAAVRQYANLVALKERYDLWKQGKPLNYADQYSYVSQDLFWRISRHFKLSGFLESLFVKNGQSQVKEPGTGAHKRLLLEFEDGTYGIYDSRVPLNNKEVAERIVALELNGKHVRSAVNLDTGMADDTRVYDTTGKPYQIGYTSQPIGTNRIGIYQKSE